MPEPIEVVQAIMEANKETLDIYSNALSLRRKALNDVAAIENFASLYVGDQVQVKNTVTPQKIRGCSGRILAFTEHKGTPAFRVRLIDPPDRDWETCTLYAHSVEAVR